MVRNRSSNARIWCDWRAPGSPCHPARTGAAPGAALHRLDLFADPARLFLAVPMADQPQLFALVQLGPQRLAQPPLVGVDHAGGGGQDMRGRAIVLLQPHHLGAGKILFEPQDVADLGAAPAIDRLVVVADAADVLVPAAPAAAATGTGRRWCPDTRRPGCSGTSAGIAPARPHASERSSAHAAADRRNRRRSGPSGAPGTAHTARPRAG